VVFSLAHPQALLALVVPGLAILVWLRLPPPLNRGRARLSLGLRLAILLCLVLAISGLQWERVPQWQTLLVLADRSASLGGSSEAERQAVLELIDKRTGEDRVGVISFGREAVVEVPPDRSPAFTDFATHPNPNYTSVESALRLAGSLILGDTRRHVVVVSDGRQNLGDAVTQARLLHSQGVRVDALPVQVPTGPEVRVEAVRAPAAVPRGGRAQARVVLDSNVETPAQLRVYLDRALIYDAPVAVTVGETEVSVTLPPAEPGFHSIRAVLDPARDTFAENNVGEALMQVLGTQRVLVVEGIAGAAGNVIRALRAASLEATVIAPDQVPRAVADLAGYQAVALVDVPASALGPERMQAIQAGVRDLGMGLAAFGGPDTFGPGGFAATPLEAALPIDMQISEQLQKPPIAVVLVLESMESPQSDSIMKGAVRAVIDQLSARDYVGVTNAMTQGLVIPLQRVTDKKKIQDAIEGLQFGDPGSYAPWLNAAADALAAQSGTSKHMIVLGDGDTQDEYTALVTRIAARGITVSAIGIPDQFMGANNPQVIAQMRSIATAGKGRFYSSNSAADVPQLLLKETQTGLKPWIVEQRFRPTLVAPSAVLAGLDLAGFPAIDGYVASTAKAAAEVVLRSPQRDPILAQWQYGLGRAVAWTSDTQGRWTADALRWPDSGRLLANLVAWTLPLAGDPALQVETSLAGDQGHVIAQLADAPPDSSVVASIVSPDLRAIEIPLQTTGPGRFEGNFPAEQVGSYLLRVNASSGGKVQHAATAGIAVAYSPEYRYLGTDLRFLEELARAGGGSVLASPAAAYKVALPPVRVHLPLFFWLLALAVLLLPFDVAARRLIFRAADAELWAALVRRGAGVPAAAEPTLARLRDRLDRVRTARRVATDGEQPPEAPDAPPATPDSDLAARLLERRRKKP
jgi:uncharacterized membrane protein